MDVGGIEPPQRWAPDLQSGTANQYPSHIPNHLPTTPQVKQSRQSQATRQKPLRMSANQGVTALLVACRRSNLPLPSPSPLCGTDNPHQH